MLLTSCGFIDDIGADVTLAYLPFGKKLFV
jgi:hypothetical protein